MRLKTIPQQFPGMLAGLHVAGINGTAISEIVSGATGAAGGAPTKNADGTYRAITGTSFTPANPAWGPTLKAEKYYLLVSMQQAIGAHNANALSDVQFGGAVGAGLYSIRSLGPQLDNIISFTGLSSTAALGTAAADGLVDLVYWHNSGETPEARRIVWAEQSLVLPSDPQINLVGAFNDAGGAVYPSTDTLTQSIIIGNTTITRPLNFASALFEFSAPCSEDELLAMAQFMANSQGNYSPLLIGRK